MRRHARELALQLLYRIEINPGDLDKIISGFWTEFDVPADTRDFAERLVRGVCLHIEHLDGLVGKHAANWKIRRMSSVDRNVLRMALYEMAYCDDIPPVVSINEAVDIAKYFGTSESGKFVNGILDGARKDLKRPARVADAGVGGLFCGENIG